MNRRFFAMILLCAIPPVAWSTPSSDEVSSPESFDVTSRLGTDSAGDLVAREIEIPNVVMEASLCRLGQRAGAAVESETQRPKVIMEVTLCTLGQRSDVKRPPLPLHIQARIFAMLGVPPDERADRLCQQLMEEKDQEPGS